MERVLLYWRESPFWQIPASRNRVPMEYSRYKYFLDWARRFAATLDPLHKCFGIFPRAHHHSFSIRCLLLPLLPRLRPSLKLLLQSHSPWRGSLTTFSPCAKGVTSTCGRQEAYHFLVGSSRVARGLCILLSTFISNARQPTLSHHHLGSLSYPGLPTTRPWPMHERWSGPVLLFSPRVDMAY